MHIHQTAIIEAGAVIGAGCEIHAYAVIKRHARLGAGVKVFEHAVIGGDPQDLSFDPFQPSFVEINDRTVLREHVTVNRATKPEASTVIGSDCFLMANSHVAHDCHLGDGVIMANAVMLAGHVHVGSQAFIGGAAGIHQFVRLGEGSMTGGLARITRDVPPFCLIAERDELSGFNVVGLRRRKVPKSTIDELKACFHFIYMPLTDPVDQAKLLLSTNPPQSREAQQFVAFFTSSKRGFTRPKNRQ